METLFLVCAACSFLISAVAVAFLVRDFRRKYISTWIGNYFRRRFQLLPNLKPTKDRPVHILFCFVDHFEPISYPSSTPQQERERMRSWVDGYPALAFRHKDSEGRPPQHTWFYPADAYNGEYLEGLVQLCRQGLGEIELHLHHSHDTDKGLRAKIAKALKDFERHGALITQESPPRHVYGFIHGNMSLDNSYGPQFCGVDNELTILRETGCYADFSMPTAPCISQTEIVNAIYYATDDPMKPKSHNQGIEMEVGKEPKDSGLPIITGPLGFNWARRKYGIVPRVDNAEIQETSPPSAKRILTWVREHVHVKGRPEWVYVKISCHGAEDRNHDVLLGRQADKMYSDLEEAFRDNPAYRLHYVTARELFNIAKAAESGRTGNPIQYRDFLIPPYQTHAAKNETGMLSGQPR
jgi:hypothetical protein